MTKSLITILVIFGLAYVAMGLYLYLFQRSFIYFPRPEATNVTANSFQLKSGGESLKIWKLNEAKTRAIIYFGGNAEAVEYNIEQFEELFNQHTVYLMNYRGYGGSTGQPREQDLYADAVATYDHLKQQHANVSLIGRSLGSGVATYLAANRPVENLVLITPFDNFQTIAQTHYPIYPASLLLQEKFDSLSRAKAINSKTLILIAEFDEIIPNKSSMRLVNAFDPDRLSVQTLSGATHNSVSGHPKYLKLIAEFLK